MALLEVRDLSVSYHLDSGPARAVDGVSFSVSQGEVLGLVGESGSGKSTIAKTLMRLLPDNASIEAGSIQFAGQELTSLTQKEFRRYRWDQISIIFQGAMSVLNPVYRIEYQIVEAIRASVPSMSRGQAGELAVKALESVGVEATRASAYPHELSGGMRQRVCIAMALCLDPVLVIADEPTTALDVITQDRVLGNLVELQAAQGIAMILVSHDMAVVAENCDTVAVTYAGRLVERGSVFEVFGAAAHPYTLGLINAIPQILQTEPLVSIPGFPPGLSERDEGCGFVGRCPFAQDVCSTLPPLVEISQGHWALCHFPERREEFRALAKSPATWSAGNGQ